MNTINQNYQNYPSFQNYNYGNLGGGFNSGNINNQAFNVGNTFLANQNSQSGKGILSEIRDASILGGVSGWAGRLWGGISATTSNALRVATKGLTNFARALGGLFAINDSINAYNSDIANGRNPWSVTDGTFIRTTATSAFSNAAAGLCGVGAGAALTATGVGSVGAFGAGAAAGTACYEGANALSDWAFDNYITPQQNDVYIN